ncbi:hypothetical protein B0J18DRAFT_368485 [Chaetomium sp. MPI-SDFR-AT-0129]|nr:hypothetical protein B0J18DRAFT_368485 [Chaetomium sp. MPI-SDFR-AT-0129]
MLPPVDSSVLQNNPEFATLYSRITTSVLNADGSTKNGPANKERRAVTEELNEYRLRAAKQHILTDALCNVAPQSQPAQHAPAPSLTRRARPPQGDAGTPSDVSPALLDLLLLLPPLLGGPSDLSSDDAAMLLSNPPFSDFPTHLPQLARLISTTLHSSAVHLARLANPSTNPSYVHRSIPALPAHAASLAATVTHHKQELTLARLAAARELTALLQDQTNVISQLLRVLEAKHGPIARSLEFRATETALTAQRQEAEAEVALWQARRDTYTPEAAQALVNYAAHLRDAKGRLNESIRTLEAELTAYGVTRDSGPGQEGGTSSAGKQKTMREMARVYHDMGRQVEEVRGDLERFGRG